MSDIEKKVMDGMSCCMPHDYYGFGCKGCPYESKSFSEKKDSDCIRKLHSDALALLKLQNAKIDLLKREADELRKERYEKHM